MISFKTGLFKDEDLFKIKYVKKAKDDVRLLLKGLRHVGKKRSGFNKIGGTASFKPARHYFSPFDKGQLCMVKFRYGNTKESHKDFLKVYMKQENKDVVIEKPEYFGDELASYEANLTAKHFKFIISPDSQNVDLEVLTKTLVDKMNKLYKADLRWIAVIHNDTAHKHVHLLINSRDKNGKYINRFDKDFIKNTMRKMAGDICTRLVGNRSYEELKAFRNNMYGKNRLTVLDKAIKNRCTVHYGNGDFQYKIGTVLIDELLRKRLDHLSTLDLAKQEGMFYLLKEDWYKALEGIGRYNSLLEVRKDYAFKGKQFEVYNKNKGKERGKVLKIYNMDDENVWHNACVVETDRKILYVPMYAKVDMSFLHKTINIDTVEKDNKKNIRITAER